MTSVPHWLEQNTTCQQRLDLLCAPLCGFQARCEERKAASSYCGRKANACWQRGHA